MLRNLAYLFINPLFWLFSLAITSFVLGRIKRQRLARLLAGIALIWLVLIYVSPVPQYMVYGLERRHVSLKPEKVLSLEKEVHIVVLGGGSYYDADFPWLARLSLTAKGRLAEGIRLHRALPGSYLLLSGHSASGRTSIAEVMGHAALSLGVSAQDTLLSTQPANTMEEAIYYKQRFGNRAHVILVTDATHMARALMAFQQVGIHVQAAPTNFRLYNDPLQPPFHWKPSLQKMQLMQTALKEYVAAWAMKIDRGLLESGKPLSDDQSLSGFAR